MSLVAWRKQNQHGHQLPLFTEVVGCIHETDANGSWADYEARLYRHYNSGDLESFRAEVEFEKTIATKEEPWRLRVKTSDTKVAVD